MPKYGESLISSLPNKGIGKMLLSQSPVAQSRNFFYLLHSFHTQGRRLHFFKRVIVDFQDITYAHEIPDICYLITCKI